MATPRGAEHRDVEQRFRNLERKVRELVSAALRREQLSVTQGDFVVSGGGDVVVEDGGNVRVTGTGRLQSHYPDGAVALTLGTFDSEQDGALMQLLEEDGATVVLQVFRQVPSTGVPGGRSSVTLRADDLSLYAGNGVDLLGGVSVFGGLSTDTVSVSTPPTTSASADLNWNSANGNIRLVTSSARYKQDIEDARVDPEAVLRLQGRTWRDRAEVAEDPDTEARYVGFIAEEVDEAGLTDLVRYDDEGRPEALQYDRFPVALLELARRQAEQIADLQARVAALESA